MPSKTFSIANQKGGVGKTTTAINLCAALARKKVPTLLVDLDPQGNATSALGFERETGKGLYAPLHGEGAAEECIIPSNRENLFLIPAEVDLAAIEIELSQKEDYLTQLRRCLKPIQESGKYKAIIIDCPPALGMLSMNSLAAADHLLITLQAEYLALEGLGQILKLVDDLKEAGVNPNLDIGGIIITMFDKRTKLARQVVKEVDTHFEDLLFETMIPRNVRLSEAPSFGQTIFEYSKISFGAFAYKNLASELIKKFELN